MTKQEIKALVAAKIAGQGSQVDVGGALPSILDAICDLIPDSSGPNIFYPLAEFEEETISEADAATKYGLTEDVFIKMNEGYYSGCSPVPYSEEGNFILPYNNPGLASVGLMFSSVIITDSTGPISTPASLSDIMQFGIHISRSDGNFIITLPGFN